MLGKENARKTAKEPQMMITESEMKPEDLIKRYQDLLEIARLVSWCTNRDYLRKSSRGTHLYSKHW